MTDPFNLDRFVLAQDPVYPDVIKELEAGYKQTHWMWFVFPQLDGLGVSSFASFYGISDLDEAVAYLAHPVLGPRLEECTRLVLDTTNRRLVDIFGADDVKFSASMTLFAEATKNENSIFHTALNSLCQGLKHQKTLDLLYNHAE